MLTQVAGELFARQYNVSDILGLRSDRLVQGAEIVVAFADGPGDGLDGLQGLGRIAH